MTLRAVLAARASPDVVSLSWVHPSPRAFQEEDFRTRSSPSYESMLMSVQPTTGLQEAAWRGHQDVDALLAGTRSLRRVLVSGSAQLEKLWSARPRSFWP